LNLFFNAPEKGHYFNKCSLEEFPEIMPWCIYLNGKFYSGKIPDIGVPQFILD